MMSCMLKDPDSITYPPKNYCQSPIRHPVTITKEGLPDFLNMDIELLKKYSHEIDPRLVRPHTVHLIMN